MGSLSARHAVPSLLDDAGELFLAGPAGRAALLARARPAEVERKFRAQIDAVHPSVSGEHAKAKDDSSAAGGRPKASSVKCGSRKTSVASADDPQAGPRLVDDGQVKAAYDASDGALFLIRPDGYVGAVSESTATIDAYLRRVARL